MKDVILAIITRLKSDTAIEAIVDDRIYRARLPNKPTFPAVVVSRVSIKRLNETHNRTGRGQTRIQCTVLAKGDTGDSIADNLSELIADSLNMVTDTYLSPGVFVISISDRGARPDNDQNQNIWLYSRDFIVNHNI